MKYFRIKGGVFNVYEDEDVTQALEHEVALTEAWRMACEVYDSYAGLHGIMSEEDYIDEGEAEDMDEAYQLYSDDRESSIEYEAIEITEEEYNSYFGEGMR